MASTSNRPFLKVSFLLGIIIVGFWLASFFPDLVLTLILSTLVAFVLKPVVRFLEFRLGLRRSLSIFVVFLLSGGLLYQIASDGLPVLIDTVQTMYDNFRKFPFEEKLNDAARGLATSIPFVSADDISKMVHNIIDGGLKFLESSLSGAVGFIVNLAIVPFVTYFILAEGDSALKKLIQRVPNKYFEMTLNVLNKIGKDLIGYMRGWILDSIIIGILSVVGYKIIGVENAILIGAVAGVANLIPYLGPVVGAVPSFLISLTQFGDFRLVLPIVIVTVTIQMIDNIIVQPLCFAKTIDLHPLTVIVVLLVGNTMLGVAGMVVAIPIFTILKASAVETYWGLRNYHITA